jgi:hypothetical protein
MTARFSFAGVLSVGSIVVLSCGDDGGPVRTLPTYDAAIDAPEPCKAADSYAPTFGSGDQTAEDYPAMGSGADATIHQIYYSAPLDANTPGDYLFIDFYEQYGGFGSGDIVPGTYTLTGDDAAYSTCGICVTIAADATDSGVDDWYVASGGILTLSSVTTNLTGTLSNVTLRRVITDAEGGPSDAPQGDCASRITSASFDAPLVMGSAAGRVLTGIPVHVLRHRKTR